MDKKTITKVKSVLFKLGLVAISIGIAYWYGTFHPNNHTLVNINKQFEDDNLRALKEIECNQSYCHTQHRLGAICKKKKIQCCVQFSLSGR